MSVGYCKLLRRSHPKANVPCARKAWCMARLAETGGEGVKDGWAFLLVLFAYALKKDPEFFEKTQKDEERKRILRKNCPAIEWEQDMGRHIPFCKMTGEPCDFVCIKQEATDGE